MGTSIVLLAYKEEENLKILLPEIINQVNILEEPFEILVIDTERPFDNTKDVCKKFGAKYINQTEPYFAGAFRTAIRHASMNNFLIMDCDGSHNPIYIPDIYNKFKSGADVVIGSRYINGGISTDSLLHQIMSRILNLIFGIALNIKTKDISTNYRMYHTDQLKAVSLTCQNYDVLQEVLFKLKIYKSSLIIKEVPIRFEKRMCGKSKRRLIHFVWSYIKTLVRIIFYRYK